MGKARLYGMTSAYTPNSKADMRHRKKVYQRGREIAERDPTQISAKRQRKQKGDTG